MKSLYLLIMVFTHTFIQLKPHVLEGASSDSAVKPKLIDNCTVRSPALFWSYVSFCCTCRLHSEVPWHSFSCGVVDVEGCRGNS